MFFKKMLIFPHLYFFARLQQEAREFLGRIVIFAEVKRQSRLRFLWFSRFSSPGLL